MWSIASSSTAVVPIASPARAGLRTRRWRTRRRGCRSCRPRRRRPTGQAELLGHGRQQLADDRVDGRRAAAAGRRRRPDIDTSVRVVRGRAERAVVAQLAMNIVDWVAVIAPVSRERHEVHRPRGTPRSPRARRAGRAAGAGCGRATGRDRSGGMPWRSIHAMNASSWRAMISKQRSVPAGVELQDQLAPPARRVASTGHDRRVLAAGADGDDVARLGRVRAVSSRTASTTAAHSLRASCSAVSPERTIGIARLARPTRVPSSATRVTLALVLPTSMPRAWATAPESRCPVDCALRGTGGPHARSRDPRGEGGRRHRRRRPAPPTSPSTAAASPRSARSTARGRREIDADGLLVTPGWVDIHTHYDGQVTWDPEVTPSQLARRHHRRHGQLRRRLRARSAPVGHDFLIELMEGVEDIPGTALHEGIDWQWETFAEYLDALDATPRVHRRRRAGAPRRAARLRDGRAGPRRGRTADEIARDGRRSSSEALARRRRRVHHLAHHPAPLEARPRARHRPRRPTSCSRIGDAHRRAPGTACSRSSSDASAPATERDVAGRARPPHRRDRHLLAGADRRSRPTRTATRWPTPRRLRGRGPATSSRRCRAGRPACCSACSRRCTRSSPTRRTAALADLPLAERVAELREPEVRAALLAERAGHRQRHRRRA